MVVGFFINSSFQFQQQIRLYVLLKCFYIVIKLQHDILLIHLLYYLLLPLLGLMDEFSLTYPLRGLRMDGLHWRSDQPQNRHYIIRSFNNIFLERIFEITFPSPLLQSRPHLTSPPLACGSPYLCPSWGRSCFSSPANSQDNVPFHHHLFGNNWSYSQKQIVDKMSFSG